MSDIEVIDSTIINAEDAIIGRLSSIVAKRLLSGEKIIVINAEKGLVSGNPGTTAKKYLQRYHMKTKSNPLKGPFYPRKPDQLLKRTIRGMLPYRKSRGKEAYGRLRVYNDFPSIFQNQSVEVLERTQLNNPKSPYISLGELYRKI
ncbi:MAG: 50S ribosomal protein L13 [Candidatus Hodarchaeales archaeon]